ncbi:hypothetical protein BFF94_038070 [Burkholderia catarinensis]|nr:hypothetical protein BFF94_038070 [Burkholderia catarinensis]
MHGTVVAALLALAIPAFAEPLQIDGLSPPRGADTGKEVLVPRFQLNTRAVLQFKLVTSACASRPGQRSFRGAWAPSTLGRKPSYIQPDRCES